MQLTKNFKLEEFEKSSTAIKYHIDNNIPDKYMNNVQKLAELLQVIRDAWDAPIKINSGYRCKELNVKIGGAKNSDHLYAAAADITTKSDKPEDNKKLFILIKSLIDLGKIQCRQLIDEYSYNWLHISINHENNSYKANQILHLKLE